MVMDTEVVVLSEPTRRRRRPPSSPDWAYLPSEILDLILNHLIQLVDYLRFSAVCKPWLSAALHQKDRRRRESTHKQAVPMLLTPPLPPTPGKMKKAAAEDHWWRRLYSVTHNKLLNWELKMMPSYDRFCGSSYGWLGAVNVDFSITLFNPFTGKSLLFPPAHPRPFVIPHPNLAGRFWENEVAKLVCSCDPSFSNLNDDFVVGTIFGSYAEFAYIKPGSNKGWTYIDGGGFSDAVYHLGKFYVVDRYCRVISVDLRSGGGGGGGSGSGSETKQKVQVVVPPITKYTPRRLYIMVSSGGGDLLLVEPVPHPVLSQTACFKIFKLLGLGNVDHQNFAEKAEIDNLGNDALFLGDGHSLCVSTSNFHGCRPNCIYYIANCRETNIYCLDDRSFMPLKGIKTRLKRAPCYPPPIWIMPTML